MDEQDTEAAGLIDLTDQVQDDAENVSGGGCLTVALFSFLWLCGRLSNPS